MKTTKMKRLITAFGTLMIVSICFWACTKKDFVSNSSTITEKSIAEKVSYNNFTSAIKSTDKLILKVRMTPKAAIANGYISVMGAAGTNTFVLQDFEIDTTKILVVRNSKNEAYYSMRLLSKKDSSTNCFYNLYVKKDSNNQITQTIVKFLPTAKSIKNNYKNFEAKCFVIQNNMSSTVNNNSTITTNSITTTGVNQGCVEVAYDIPCDNGFVHDEGDGPGDWCDVNGSYKIRFLDCGSGGSAIPGSGSATGGNGNNNGNGNGNGNGNVLVTPPGNNNNNIINCEVPETDQFINQLYTDNIVWASQNVSLFNQICGSLCGANSETDKEKAKLSIAYYIKLKPILDNNPNALLPCDSLNIMPFETYGSMHQRVGSFKVPQSILNSLDSVNAILFGAGITPLFEVQSLDYGTSTYSRVNCDYFPVRIKKLPPGYTPKSLVEYFRKNINSFINGNPDVDFSPYNYLGVNYTNWFNQPYQNSLGAVVNITDQMIPVILHMSAAVIVSDYYTSDVLGNEKARFKFATITAPITGTHPVSGNREFGIFADTSHPGEYAFYTMGVDRVTDIVGAIASKTTNLGYERADVLWTRIQEQMAAFIIANGGEATFYTPKNIKARPRWDDVEKFLKGEIDFNELKRRLGC